MRRRCACWGRRRIATLRSAKRACSPREGRVTPEAKQDFEAALALDPKSAMARYLHRPRGGAERRARQGDESLVQAARRRAGRRALASARRGAARAIARRAGGRGAQASEEGAKIAAMPRGRAARRDPLHGRAAARHGSSRMATMSTAGCGSSAPIACWTRREKAKTALDGARKALAAGQGRPRPRRRSGARIGRRRMTR